MRLFPNSKCYRPAPGKPPPPTEVSVEPKEIPITSAASPDKLESLNRGEEVVEQMPVEKLKEVGEVRDGKIEKASLRLEEDIEKEGVEKVDIGREPRGRVGVSG